MRIAFVLGSLNAMAAWQLLSLKVDCVYYFSSHELSLTEYPVKLRRLANPQLNILEESDIVERCIERNISNLAALGGDAAVMRRALRLSELRVEARCYLNAVELLQKQSSQAGTSIESVTVVSHYIFSEDVLPTSSISMCWHHAVHTRFLGLIPGLSRLLFCFSYWARARSVSKGAA